MGEGEGEGGVCVTLSELLYVDLEDVAGGGHRGTGDCAVLSRYYTRCVLSNHRVISTVSSSKG